MTVAEIVIAGFLFNIAIFLGCIWLCLRKINGRLGAISVYFMTKGSEENLTDKMIKVANKMDRSL